jgi:hypothetical protein
VATNEALVLDGLALNDGTNLTLEELDLTPPAELEEWVKGADSDGALLAREPKAENRTITLTLRVEQKATMDLAIAQIKAVLDKLKECQRNTNGLALTYLPHDSALPVITFRCLSGQITGMPINITSGWLVNSPQLLVKLTCLPFGEAAEYLEGTVTTANPLAELAMSAVPGDVPALGRLVVTDNATQHRRWMAWGIDQTPATGTLILNSSVMTTTGYAGAANAAFTGGYTADAISTTLLTEPQAVCGIVNQTHVGSYRALLRFSVATATTMALRLLYQVGDGPFRALSYKVPVTLGWNLVDMGEIVVPVTALGSQKWTGYLEAYSTDVGGEVLAVDVLLLVPSEKFGRARAAGTDLAGPVVAYDAFTGTTAAAVLNARVAPLGGTWATSGVATDFTFADLEGGEVITRASTGPEAATGRIAALGAVSRTAVRMSIRFRIDVNVSKQLFSLVPRYVSGALAAGCTFQTFTASKNELSIFVTGAPSSTVTTGTTLYNNFRREVATWYRLWCSVSATGMLRAVLTTDSGAEIARVSLYDPQLATGGTIATGTARFLESNPLSGTPNTRYYDDIYITTPPAEQMVCFSGQSIEVRHNATLREDSTGVYGGLPQEYVGARFTVPNAGGPARS